MGARIYKSDRLVSHGRRRRDEKMEGRKAMKRETDRIERRGDSMARSGVEKLKGSLSIFKLIESPSFWLVQLGE